MKKGEARMGVSQLWPPAYEVQSRVRASGVFWHGVTNQLWRPSPINPYPPQTSLDVATIGVPPPLFGPSDERRTVRGKASKTPGNNKQGASRTTHNIKQENQMKKKKQHAISLLSCRSMDLFFQNFS